MSLGPAPGRSTSDDWRELVGRECFCWSTAGRCLNRVEVPGTKVGGSTRPAAQDRLSV